MHRPQRAFRWSDWSTVDRIAVLSLLAAAIVEIVSLVRLPVEGYDTPFHYYWIESWHELWRQGIYYPRWLPHSFEGFGAPSFYFYPPLSYAAASVLYHFVPSAHPLEIAKALFVLALAGSGTTMWFYLRSHGIGTMAALLGMTLYLFAPYRFLDFNTRTALSEHIAFVFLPLAFWAADRLIERRGVLAASLVLIGSLAMLVLTNLPSAATMFLALIVYAMASSRGQVLRNTGWLAALCAVSALLTAFYLLPIAWFFRDVRIGIIWDTSSIGCGNALLALFEGISLRINLYNSFSFLGACLMLFFWWRERAVALPSHSANSSKLVREGSLLAMIVVLQLPYLTTWLFYHVPPFSIIQLPPRLSLLLLILAAVAWAERLDRSNLRAGELPMRRAGISWVVTFWSISTALLVAAQIVGLQVHPHYVLGMHDAPEYITKWSPSFRNDFSAFKSGFADSGQQIIWSSQGASSIQVLYSGPYNDTIEYQRNDSSLAILHRIYWPAWSVRIDGRSALTRPDPLGRLSFPAPPGNHRIDVALETTPAERAGNWTSLITLAALLGGTLFGRVRKNHHYDA